MAKRKLKGHWIFISITVASILIFSFLTPKGQKTYDAWQENLRSQTNIWHHKVGRPLPGTPDLTKFQERLTARNLKLGAPLFMRVFKLEGELEVWMQGPEGFTLFATYPICRWSGGLGPKLKEGDGQSPEGIYTVRKGQLNPNSRWYRSFNLGYPNAYDKAYNRTGSFLMVHGGCSSIGCYAMTNPVMKEIWDLVTATYKKGSKSFMVHAFPFRMTERNMRLYSNTKWQPLWNDLKVAYDLFEENNIPPEVNVCQKRYVVTKGSLKKKTYQSPIKQGCPPKKVSSQREPLSTVN